MGKINKKGSDADFFQKLGMAIKYKNEELFEQCGVAIQSFLFEPKKMVAKIQAQQVQALGVGVSTDFPLLTTPNFNVTIEKDNFDMGYDMAYKSVSLEKGRLNWTIYDVQNSISFFKVEEGQKLEQGGLTGSRAIAEVEYYGSAIGWTDKMIRGREIPAMIDKIGLVRNKYWANKANIYYALLAVAAALHNVAWQGVAADGRTLRDILTLNRAIYLLGFVNRNKGYGDPTLNNYVLYANWNDKERIEAIYNATASSIIAARENGITVLGKPQTIYTYNSFIQSGHPILVWKGQKIQKAEVMSPTVYGPELDILSLNTIQTVWAIHGGVIADDAQCLQITLG